MLFQEFRPLLADITLYNDDKGKIMPQTNVRPVMNDVKGQSQGMSFKEWKMKQVRFSLLYDSVTLVKGFYLISRNKMYSEATMCCLE